MTASTEAKSVTTLRDIAFGGPGDTLTVVFDQAGTFAAMHAAEQWCRDHGVSYGPSDRSGTQGLLVGNYAIAKWRNLTPKERSQCHGTITGDGREGPVELRISRAALSGAKA